MFQVLTTPKGYFSKDFYLDSCIWDEIKVIKNLESFNGRIKFSLGIPSLCFTNLQTVKRKPSLYKLLTFTACSLCCPDLKVREPLSTTLYLNSRSDENDAPKLKN